MGMILHVRRRWMASGLCAVVVCASAWLSVRWPIHRQVDQALLSEAMPTVTVDAGHGGFDGGASAADGTEEKELNLSVALPLRDMLRLCGVRVVMTRESDVALCEEDGLPIRKKKVNDMQERLALFEQADWNVSIHQNTFSGASSHGTQVFYSANHPASEPLAAAVQSQVVAWLQPDNTRPIKSGNRDIYLLYKTTAPTVLVECGFLSHPQECAKLKSAAYQRELAWTIASGLMRRITEEKGVMAE